MAHDRRMTRARPRVAAWWVWRKACCLAVVVALVACGSPAIRPAGVPVAQIRVVAGPEPSLEAGLAGKAKTAAGGAVAGGLGAGLTAAIACLPLGPFAAACLAAAVPASLAVGAAAGGVAGAVMADDEETLLTKRRLLAAHVDAIRPGATLAAALRGALVGEQDTLVDAATWQAQVDVAYLAADTGALDKPFKLVLRSSLTLQGPASPPAATRHYETKSVQAETLDGWQADEGRQLRSAMRAMLREVAARMADDLRR